MDDNYSHPDEHVFYAVENLLGPYEDTKEYEKLMDNFCSQLTECCKCSGVCISHYCVCTQRSGGFNYTFNELSNELSLDECKMTSNKITPLIECNNLCACPQSCGNRLVQKGPRKSLYTQICPNEGKGRGLFTNKFISKGSFLCEYAGEVITKTQAITRHKENSICKKMNYIICLKEHSSSKVTETFVDPSVIGNIGRYANHSCNPNCLIVPVRVNSPVPKLAIFSCMDILKDTEITFCYGMKNIKDCKDHSKTKCLCGSSECIGWLPYEVY